ncbi:hypothetical protein ILUMI_00931 [Ignelater luminosus]|uniref:Uncharacterized protein n=1 Tax=Ignelater luminosus TaxID=2038154 RepID=A0A8K0DL06_IGNLU|nr:hypothetical protein ILUMI_00931 [Ignelater luminosus]
MVKNKLAVKLNRDSHKLLLNNLDNSNNIPKPETKQNVITDMSGEGIGIQMNAPPTKGGSIMKLIRYMFEAIGVRRRNIVLKEEASSRPDPPFPKYLVFANANYKHIDVHRWPVGEESPICV